MSALTAHIRVLRVEAAELINESRVAFSDGQAATADGETGSAMVSLTAAMVLARMGNVKFATADALEAEDREQEAKVAK